MRCGVCQPTLVNETEELLNGTPDFWVCRKCYITRELEPCDKPETLAEKELHDKLFAGKVNPRRLSDDIDEILADLRAQLEKIRSQRKEGG